MAKKLIIKCPQCAAEFDYYTSEFRPFCSDRCRMVDLGHWLYENYKVPSQETPSEEDIEQLGNTDDNDE